jgi:hypothetical protein
LVVYGFHTRPVWRMMPRMQREWQERHEARANGVIRLCQV